MHKTIRTPVYDAADFERGLQEALEATQEAIGMVGGMIELAPPCPLERIAAALERIADAMEAATRLPATVVWDQDGRSRCIRPTDTPLLALSQRLVHGP